VLWDGEAMYIYYAAMKNTIKKMPDEITRAHNGELFMDEFSEFSWSVLEATSSPDESQERKN
jgi:predicted ATPase with chaperone activity